MGWVPCDIVANMRDSDAIMNEFGQKNISSLITSAMVPWTL